MANYNSAYTGAQIDAGIGKADSVISGWIAPGRLLLSNNSGSITDTMDVSAGSCADSSGANILTLSAAMSKDVSSSWAAGDGNGGLDSTSTWGASTTYHCHIIKNPTTSAVDVFFSEDLVPTLPTDYTLRRHIGSVVTDGDTEIVAFFTNDGDFISYSSSQTIFQATTGIPTTRTAYSLAVPDGYAVRPIIGAKLKNTNNVRSNCIIGFYTNDVAGTEIILIDTFASPSGQMWLEHAISLLPGFTNSSAQIDFKAAESTADYYIITCAGYQCNREAFV